MTSSVSENISDGVEWIDETANPPGGPFQGKSEFLAHVFNRFTEALPQGTELRIERVLVNAQRAVVTMRFLPMPKRDLGLGYRYWWIFSRGRTAHHHFDAHRFVAFDAYRERR